MRLNFVSFVLILLGLATKSFAANVNLTKDSIGPSANEWSYTIRLEGDIDQNSPRQLNSAIMKIRSLEPNSKGVINLFLNSGGGDLEAGIKIGEIARSNEMTTWIPKNAICASACAVAYLGGVIRSTFGRYGIHRPYTNHYNETEEDARKSYDLINKLIEAYLSHMHITPRLLEAMNLVPPGDIRWLSESERNEFGIDGGDPVYSDRKQSEYARKLGITKGELYHRQQRANSECVRSPAMDQCHRDIYEGRR